MELTDVESMEDLWNVSGNGLPQGSERCLVDCPGNCGVGGEPECETDHDKQDHPKDNCPDRRGRETTSTPMMPLLVAAAR